MAEEFKQIIRIMGADIKGEMQTYNALTKIHGISFMLSNAICNVLKLNKNEKIGSLSNEELKKIESVIKQDAFPTWLKNRRKDMDSGKDLHLVSTDLKFQKELDIKHLRKIRCYRGIRHSLGLPVRGQRTRSNFRKGKTVGVKKKSVKTASGKK
ncbi:30S ribosomal protein S13 [Candidatus Woesearchaeota archaeon]|nr:30S ribosomal protein S13 [Candidatus Woesearchaeota archaeon]